MTDYGRGPAPQPWYPDDPLFGDLDGQAGAQGYPHGAWGPSVDAAQQYPQYDTQQYAQGGVRQQQGYWDGTGQYDAWQQQPAHAAHGTGYSDFYGQQQPAPYGHPGHPQPHQPVPQQPLPERWRAPEAANTAEWQALDEETYGSDSEELEEPETHPFFTGAAADDDGGGEEYDERDGKEADQGSPRRQEKKRRGTKRRSGCAFLGMVLIFGGVLGGGGYLGYGYWQDHFGAPPDFSGDGTGELQVTIPDHATLAQMGNILKKDDVVKSVDAFTKAATANPRGASIQGGVYILHKEMSAAAAVTMLLDPAAQSALIIPEGTRATGVYEALDKKLSLPPGTTAQAARGDLGLPDYAKGNPEGFLFPSRYSVGQDSKPADVLKQMVQQAEAEYTKDDIQAQAAKLGMTPYQIIVVASLIQAEAKEPQDFGRVSRVIYNRLKQNIALDFDSTINYALNRSTLTTTNSDLSTHSLYNTYLHKGLPPGPIDNPGHMAIEAALNPTPGDWLYFVTVKPGDTRFTASWAEHKRNVAEFNQYQRTHGGS